MIPKDRACFESLPGQYLVAPREIPGFELPTWTKHTIGHWILRTNEPLPVNQVTNQEGNVIGRVLGNAVGAADSTSLVFPISSTRNDSNMESAALGFLSIHGGRYLLIIITPGFNRIYPDAGGFLPAYFNGEEKTISSSAVEPYALSNGDTLTVVLEDGEDQAIVFQSEDFADIGQATGVEVAAVINAQLVGGKAIFDEATKISILSDIQGTASRIQVAGGTANSVLGFDSAEHMGNGTIIQQDRDGSTIRKWTIYEAWPLFSRPSRAEWSIYFASKSTPEKTNTPLFHSLSNTHLHHILSLVFYTPTTM